MFASSHFAGFNDGLLRFFQGAGVCIQCLRLGFLLLRTLGVDAVLVHDADGLLHILCVGIATRSHEAGDEHEEDNNGFSHNQCV